MHMDTSEHTHSVLQESGQTRWTWDQEIQLECTFVVYGSLNLVSIVLISWIWQAKISSNLQSYSKWNIVSTIEKSGKKGTRRKRSSAIIVFKDLKRNGFQDWCAGVYIVKFQRRDLQLSRAATRVEREKCTRHAKLECKGCEEENHKSGLPTTAPCAEIDAAIVLSCCAHNISLETGKLSEYYRYASRFKIMPKVLKQDHLRKPIREPSESLPVTLWNLCNTN